MRPSCGAAAPKRSTHGVWGADRQHVPNSDMTYENRTSEATPASRFRLPATRSSGLTPCAVVHNEKQEGGIKDEGSGSRKQEAVNHR
jgi:hypothetical protein